MRRVVLIAAVAAVIAPTARAAAPAGFYEAKELEPAASFVARKPVKVMCSNSVAAWTRYLNAAFETRDTIGVAVPGPGGTQERLTILACQALDEFNGSLLLTPLQRYVLAGSIETLAHEAIHLRGVSDEGITDCDAMHEMPAVAVRYFKFKPGTELRALMASAWADHHKADAIYRSVC